MSKHTLGPWEINEQYIIARSKRGLRTVCQWGSYTDEADARLLAAAPDLLAAVKAMSEYMAYAEILGEDKAVFKNARAAIAKAEGVS